MGGDEGLVDDDGLAGAAGAEPRVPAEDPAEAPSSARGAGLAQEGRPGPDRRPDDED